MPKDSADTLSAAVDELHFSERQPKQAVLAALVTVALNHLDEVRQHLGNDR